MYSVKIRGCFFALMADEQLSIVVCAIDPNGNAHDYQSGLSSLFQEYFLGLIELNEFEAETFIGEIIGFLSSHRIHLNKCITMCFDE